MTSTPTLTASAQLGAWLRPKLAWSLLLFAPLAGLWWGRGHVLPSVACASFSGALVVMGLAGRLAQQLVDHLGQHDDATRAGPPAGIFQLLWLGQYALLAFVLALTPVAALWTDVTGWKVPLRATLPSFVLLATYLHGKRTRRAGSRVGEPPRHSLLLASLVAFAAFRALSLHSVHAGALGHDTQQHLYWTQHIIDYGFLPLTSRDSDLIDPYPKIFHLLAACWSAAGLSSTPGIYVKMMPFLQAALACGFLCELLLAAKTASGERDRGALPVLMGIFLCWHLTLGDGQEVYRVRDLSGTPRYSAGWILFTPPLLILAQRAGTFRDLRPWLIGLLPVLPALALGVNPVIVVLLVSYSMPVAGALYLATRDGAPAQNFAWRRALAWGSGAAAVCVLANNFVINALANRAVAGAVLRWLGIRTTAAGVPIDIWIPREGEGQPFCTVSWHSCAYDTVVDAVRTGFVGYIDALSTGTLPGLLDGDFTRWYWVAFSMPLLVLAVYALRGQAAGVAARDARVFLGILSASVVAAGVVLLVRAALIGLQPLGPLWALLADYYRSHAVFLGTWLRCLLPMSSWMLAPAISLPVRWLGGVWGLAALFVIHFLGSFAPPDLVKHRYATSWKIDWPELRAIKHLNAFVPEHETVLITGRHWVRKGREHLLIADDPLGMIVPHLTTRLLFGIGLGSGIDYSWADLDQTFCGKSSEARLRLLRQVNARWVLARDKKVTSRAVFENLSWDCGVRLADLSAEYPPAWSEADLALYHINP